MNYLEIEEVAITCPYCEGCQDTWSPAPFKSDPDWRQEECPSCRATGRIYVLPALANQARAIARIEAMAAPDVDQIDIWEKLKAQVLVEIRSAS